jgi:hypothetical protein
MWHGMPYSEKNESFMLNKVLRLRREKQKKMTIMKDCQFAHQLTVTIIASKAVHCMTDTQDTSTQR